MLEDARLMLDIALGLILFELGSRLDWQWFRRNRWLLASSVAEIALSFGFIYLVLALLRPAPPAGRDAARHRCGDGRACAAAGDPRSARGRTG